jgi:hypothetical protein
MTTKEIVLKMQNKPGELSRIIGHLYENDVTVSAFWIGTENGQTVLRFMPNDPDSAVSVLTGLAIEASTADVIAVHLPDHPGGFNSLLQVLASAGIDILRLYSGLDTATPVLILAVDKTKEAVRALKDHWFRLQEGSLY